MTRSQATAKGCLAEARETLEADRDEATRLREAFEQRDEVVAERDRLARQLEVALTERHDLAAEVRRAGAETPLVPSMAAGPVARVGANRHPSDGRGARLFAIIALVVALLAVPRRSLGLGASAQRRRYRQGQAPTAH